MNTERPEAPDQSPETCSDPSPHIADEWQTQQVVLRFTAHFDAGEHERMELLFAPDAVWHQARGPIHGRAELRQRMASLPPDQVMRHVLTNLRTTMLSRDEAVVDSYFTVYLQRRSGDTTAPTATRGPRSVGRYRDRLRRIEGRWLLYERRVTFDLTLPASDADG
jgi:SnoaL-like protein